MNIRDFDYQLPENQIAQRPTDKRDDAKLLVVNRKADTITHRHFYDMLDYLKPTDCLVLNNSKVLPARLFGEKEGTGGKVEFLLTKRIKENIWETMIRPGKRLKPGNVVVFAEDFKAEIFAFGKDGTRQVKFSYKGNFMERLEELGKVPLPPYIDRNSDENDKDRYQTVYCKEEGSVAAPTAGLHFTEELLEKVREKGIKIAYVTLHVGIGTFRPVSCETIEDHPMHFEEYEITEKNAEILNKTKADGGRIVAVGTTSVRTLESAATSVEEPGKAETSPKAEDEGKAKKLRNTGRTGNQEVKAGAGNTDIFIYPGYDFKMVDALITNFHLPKSTLLMLVSAFYDREKILSIYEEAVRKNYRFFSYGDAMLIE